MAATGSGNAVFCRLLLTPQGAISLPSLSDTLNSASHLSHSSSDFGQSASMCSMMRFGISSISYLRDISMRGMARMGRSLSLFLSESELEG